MPFDAPSRLDLYALARQFVTTRATKIDPAQVDIEGSEVNLYAGMSSVVGYQVVLALLASVNSLLLDGAYDEDLDRYGVDRYQLPRKGAAAAVGAVRMFRSSTAAGAGSVPANTPLLTLNGVEYVTTTPATFGALDLEVDGVQVRAGQAGKTSQVGANQIRSFAQAGLLFDPSIQVNNDEATAGGEDVESDEDYRERIRDFWRTARRGTCDAIELGARSVPGVVTAEASEALTGDAQPARVAQLYIADSSGVASAALAAQVRAVLDEYRACGVGVLVQTSIPEIVEIDLRLTFAAGVDTLTLSQLIRANVVEFVNSLAVNQTLYRADLFSVLRRFASDGLLVTQGTVIEPTGDLVPTAGRTLRTRIQNVVVS